MLILAMTFLTSCDKEQGPLEEEPKVEEDLNGFDVSEPLTDISYYRVSVDDDGEFSLREDNGRAFGKSLVIDPPNNTTWALHIKTSNNCECYSQIYSGSSGPGSGVGFTLDIPGAAILPVTEHNIHTFAFKVVDVVSGSHTYVLRKENGNNVLDSDTETISVSQKFRAVAKVHTGLVPSESEIVKI